MNWSNDQLRAISLAERFIEYGDQQFFTIHGLAGTGKSTVLAELARRYPQSILCAPTGKAAVVLRDKVGMPVMTMHRVLYYFRGVVRDDPLDDEDFRQHPVFEFNGRDLSRHVVLLDESSMVGSVAGEDLLSTKAKIVAVGDNGQLKPVKDSQFFEKADVMLEEIHRQAADSPIIRQARAVRHGSSYKADGPDFQVVSLATDDMFRSVDIALCWKNATRIALNRRRRAAFGYSGEVLRRGEPVMVLRNSYEYGIFNGEWYNLAYDRHPGDPVFIRVGTEVCRIDWVTIEGIDKGFDRDQYVNDVVPFAMAYAATVHKAQGSQFRSVMMVDEPDLDNSSERRSLLYTGITRAEKSVIMVKRRD